MLRALGFASFDITHETGGTICYRALSSAADLRLVISHTRQGVRFVMGIGFCVLRLHTRNRGYELLRALESASCDITDETRGTICYGHWVLRLVISRTEQGIQFITSIKFCVL